MLIFDFKHLPVERNVCIQTPHTGPSSQETSMEELVKHFHAGFEIRLYMVLDN